MKHFLLTTIAAVVLVVCGQLIHEAALDINIEAAKKAIAAGANMNAKDGIGGKTTARMGEIKDQYFV